MIHAPGVAISVASPGVEPHFVMSAVLSPCVGICELDESGLCLGCRRSGEEIADWLKFSEARRRYLMDEVLPARQTVES